MFLFLTYFTVQYSRLFKNLILMRIAKMFIPEEETKKKGLEEINLTRKPLCATVALVGKNGAGKSRILEYVQNYINLIDSEKLCNGNIQSIPKDIILNNQVNYDSSVGLIKKINKVGLKEKAKLKAQLNRLMKPIYDRFLRTRQSYIKVVNNEDLIKIKNNIQSNRRQIPGQITFEQMLDNPSLVIQQQNINEFNELNSDSTVEYLKKLTNEIVTDEFNLYVRNRDNPQLVRPSIQEKKSYQRFEILQKYINKFLGKEFSYEQKTIGNTINSTLYFNGKPFDLNLFSPGQKTLFAYAILFFYLEVNSKASLNECIIIIDEPEKHLHPEAQIDLINALKSIVVESGQLWIATHSVHILSHLEYDEILMVEDNRIIPPSRTTPGKSFNSLMGLDTHISKLTTFINSVSEWAYGNFMSQCFKEPDVIFDNNPNDPQFKLFKKFLTETQKSNLLDYGAGKGRIGYTLNENDEILEKIMYSAFEPNDENHKLLNNVPNIKNVYLNTKNIPDNSFDCVLLCNVLHEINPKQWEEALKTIKRSLKDDGYLLIIEDKFLPKGETAHEFGYLILGTEETKILLNSENIMELKLKEERFKDRILFNAFKKEEINPSSESICQSIEKLKETSFENIKYLRNEEKTIAQGRRYANQTQLYVNAQLALEAMKVVDKV